MGGHRTWGLGDTAPLDHLSTRPTHLDVEGHGVLAFPSSRGLGGHGWGHADMGFRGHGGDMVTWDMGCR